MMRTILTMTLSLGVCFQIFCCDDDTQQLNTTIPYYVLKAKKGFRDIIVSKVAFDSTLKNNKSEVLGFEYPIFKDSSFVGYTIPFTLDSTADNSPGESAKIFTVDIPHITHTEGKNQYFRDINKALEFMEKQL